MAQLLYQVHAANDADGTAMKTRFAHWQGLQVEGKLSIACYLTALDHCYTHLCQKAEHLRERQQSGTKAAMSYPFSLADVDYCVMHVRPFNIGVFLCIWPDLKAHVHAFVF